MRSNALHSSSSPRADGALAEFATRDNLSVQPAFEVNALADSHFASRPDQRLPLAAVSGRGRSKKHLDLRAQVLAQSWIVLAYRQ
jgi:hypothetical protein